MMKSLSCALLAGIVPTESWEPKPSSLVCYMAAESTTVSMNDTVNPTLVEPVIIMALSEQPGMAVRMCREFNWLDRKATAIVIPTQTSYWGSPNDDGAGVDLEFDGVQGTALGNTQVATGGVTATPVEYGVAHALTDNLAEDSAIDGAELMNLFTSQMLTVLQLALDDDFLALLVSLSNSVGSTGVDLTIAQAIAAQQGLRTRGAVADLVAFILDNEQALNLETAFQATNAAAAIFAMSADRLIGYSPTGDHGMGTNRQVMSLRGFPAFATGLTDTANAAADVVGAALCPSTAVNDASGATTFGMGWKRLPRFEMQRQAKGRSTDLVMTMRAATFELQDGSGTAIITDAP
jgi:hypothetical protein